MSEIDPTQQHIERSPPEVPPQPICSACHTAIGGSAVASMVTEMGRPAGAVVSEATERGSMKAIKGRVRPSVLGRPAKKPRVIVVSDKKK